MHAASHSMHVCLTSASMPKRCEAAEEVLHGQILMANLRATKPYATRPRASDDNLDRNCFSSVEMRLRVFHLR